DESTRLPHPPRPERARDARPGHRGLGRGEDGRRGGSGPRHAVPLAEGDGGAGVDPGGAPADGGGGPAPEVLRDHGGGAEAGGGGGGAVGAAGGGGAGREVAAAAGVMDGPWLSARVFRLLLLLYPRPFREAYGEATLGFFVARLKRAREVGGRAGVQRVWLHTSVDMLKAAAAERRGWIARDGDRTKGDDLVSSLMQDVRYAARRLRLTPLFTVSAIAILGVGIGLN